MKTILFTWLLLLPVQMYALELDKNSLQMETSIPKVETNSLSESSVQEMNYQEIAFSQQQEIQKLQNALAQKNNEINSQDLNQLTFQSATLLFFIGMLLFAFLYIRTQVSFSTKESINFEPYHYSGK